MATSRHRTASAAFSASRDCAMRVDLTRIHGPQDVMVRYHQQKPPTTRQNSQQNQRKRSANKTSKEKNANQKPIVRLTNKERIDSKLLNLTLDVNGLREELRSLELYRNVLQARVLLKPQDGNGSFVQKARQYFYVFRRGYKVLDAETQHAFLQAVTDDACVTTRCPWAVRLDGLGPTGIGLMSLLEQWQTYSEYFALRFVTPPTFSVVTTDADKTCVVRCETTLNASFTWQALHVMFPAVANDPLLMQELLGREMVTPICFHLHFDRQGRMVRHDFTPDFFAALLHALKDPVKVAKIMEVTEAADNGGVGFVGEDQQPQPPVGESYEDARLQRPEEGLTDQKPEGREGSRHTIAYLL